MVVSLSSKELRADENGFGKGSLRINIPEGYHINSSDPPARWLVPTKIEISPLKARIDYPAADADSYRGEIDIPFSVELPKGESGADFELVVSYQACTEQECLLAEEKRFSAVLVR